MTKDTYWFPHDYDPTNDPKLKAMLDDYGGLGYGIYWRIVEMFHSEAKHKLAFKKYIYLAIAKEMRPNPKQNKFLLNAADVGHELIESFVKDCISEYELFEADDTHFWSERANRNIEKKEGISSERSKAALKSVEVRKNKQNLANAEQKSAHNTTQEKIREDYIRKDTHRFFSDQNELKNDAVAEMKNISSVFLLFNGMKQKRIDHLAQKISEKYVNQKINAFRSLMLEWVERDQVKNPKEYVIDSTSPF